MTAGRLTAVQVRVLVALAPLRAQWTLSGGGALAGFHLRHRSTRDLDLFWHGTSSFAREPEECVDLLALAGMSVHVLQRSPGFVRLTAQAAGETVLVDLVAEPVPRIEPPGEVWLGTARICVDTPHEILVNKLGALLHRAEIRDLIDLQALLACGGDLDRALAGAAQKDGGFSPLMLGYLLRSFPIERQAAVAGLDAGAVAALAQCRDQLVALLAGKSRP